jgi:hypothetical protein
MTSNLIKATHYQAHGSFVVHMILETLHSQKLYKPFRMFWEVTPSL